MCTHRSGGFRQKVKDLSLPELGERHQDGHYIASSHPSVHTWVEFPMFGCPTRSAWMLKPPSGVQYTDRLSAGSSLRSATSVDVRWRARGYTGSHCEWRASVPGPVSPNPPASWPPRAACHPGICVWNLEWIHQVRPGGPSSRGKVECSPRSSSLSTYYKSLGWQRGAGLSLRVRPSVGNEPQLSITSGPFAARLVGVPPHPSCSSTSSLESFVWDS